MSGMESFVVDSSRQGAQLPSKVVNAFAKKEAQSPQGDATRFIQDLLLEHRDLEFGKPLGAGGFGEVFQGRWNFNDVAIKVLSSKKFTPAALEEFRQEAAIMAKMRSDYIVQLRGYCESPSYCLVMEYMPVGSLYDVLHNAQDLPWFMRLRIGLDLSYGLAQLHNVKILHRDLKSLNVLLYEAGGLLRARLADFGLSKMKTESNSLSTVSSKSVGTLAWMAPELLSLRPKYGVQSDMYGYGMVLWELAERQVPFAEANRDVLRAEIAAGRAKEEFSQEVIDSRPQYIRLAESCWSVVGKRPSAAEAVKLMEGLFQREMKEQAESKSNVGSPVSQFSSGLQSNHSSLSSGSLSSGLQGNLQSELLGRAGLGSDFSPQVSEAAKELAGLRIAAEEWRLAEEKRRLEGEQLKAEVRQLEAEKEHQELMAKKAQLEAEKRIREEAQAKQAKEREAILQRQKEQEEVQRKAKEEVLKREAAEKARREEGEALAKQEKIKASWISKLDPKTNKVYYSNTVTQARVETAPEGYKSEGAALEAEQEEARRASYALDQQKKTAEAALREAKDSKEVEVLLTHVVQGEQAKAETLLKANPGLSLYKGTVTDLSKRTFKGITAFQYAVWALDWHMWKMLLKYISPEAAAMQFQELEDKGTAHGKHFSLTPLIGALTSYVQNYDAWAKASNYSAMETHWCREVGGAQLLLPVHVAQEYCHPTRSFVPVPSFTEEELVRSMKLHGNQGNWYTAEYNGAKLGEKFGIVRYNMAAVKLMYYQANRFDYVKGDAEAIQSLWKVRQLQLEGLKTNLLQSKAQTAVKR